MKKLAPVPDFNGILPPPNFIWSSGWVTWTPRRPSCWGEGGLEEVGEFNKNEMAEGTFLSVLGFT